MKALQCKAIGDGTAGTAMAVPLFATKGTKVQPPARLPAHGRLLGCVVIINRMRTAN